jgi:hypothetical protein
VSRDLFDSALARLDPALAAQLRTAFDTVMDRMQANHLAVDEGWTLGWRHIRGDAEVKGSERYYFIPVRIVEGRPAESRPDLSVTVVLV